MNKQRNLAILLLGMSVSACTQHQPFRTATLAAPSFGSRTQAEQWPPKCAVDEMLAKDRKLELCEDRNSTDSPAIQHRHYYEKTELEKKSADERQPLDYYLSFVEFDDQGWFADRGQMTALFALLEKLETEDQDKKSNGHTLIYVYAHGWKHNASPCDNNVVCFSRLLERHDVAEKMERVMTEQDPKFRTVVGVYVGWRGLPYKAGPLTNFSFWSRKEAAVRVGRGGVFELLTRLKDYRDARQKEYASSESPDNVSLGVPTQLVITGHSFGGLVIYSALSHALMERAAKTRTNEDGATDYDVAQSFGDFVMIVNPAFQGSLYEPLFQIATNRCYDKRDTPESDKQRPVMMIVTSETDSATGKAFPMGQTLGTLFQHATSSEQKQSMRKAIGHDPRYRTHKLVWDVPEGGGSKKKAPKEDRPCPCPHVTATSDLTLGELLGPYLDALLEEVFKSIQEDGADAPKTPEYGEGISLEPVSSPTYVSSYPYLVVSADASVIPNHDAVYNDLFTLFTQRFFLNHIVGSQAWTLDAREAYESVAGSIVATQSCASQNATRRPYKPGVRPTSSSQTPSFAGVSPSGVEPHSPLVLLRTNRGMP